MTPQELLIPRVKCTAIEGAKEHYPESPFAIGEILTYFEEEGTGHEFYIGKKQGLPVSVINKNSHLFKELHWAERRNPEDMPEYVKDKFKVFKVKEWKLAGNVSFFSDDCTIPYHPMRIGNNVHPATEEEYNNYIASKNKT